MEERTVTSAVSVLLAVLGLAIIAVLVSQKAKTGSVLGAFGSAISNAICVALSPVTGGACASATNISSGVNFGCTTVDGIQYCP